MSDMPPTPPPSGSLPPPSGPPPAAVETATGVAQPPSGERNQRLLVAALAVVALIGGGLVWMSFGGGPEEMREGTVSIPAYDEGNDGSSVESDNGAAMTTVVPDTAAVTTVVTTLPTETTTPPTTIPATSIPPMTNPPMTLAPTTAPPATSAPGVVFAGRCRSDYYGWDVGIPEGWFGVDDPAGWWTCAGFERYPITVETDTELVVPITIVFFEGQRATDVLASYSDGSFVEILSEGVTTVGTYDAWRLETSAVGDGYFENGTLAVTYIIDRGSSTVLIDGFGYTPAEYEEVKVIVDAMAVDIAFMDS